MCPPERIKNNPDNYLLKEVETKDSLINGNVINFLKRWANKHLKAAGNPKEIKKF